MATVQSRANVVRRIKGDIMGAMTLGEYFERAIKEHPEWLDISPVKLSHEESQALTWDTLCELEPQLAALVSDAKQDCRRNDGDWYAYEEYKSRGAALVGFFSKHKDKRVRSCRAYELMIRQIADALEL